MRHKIKNVIVKVKKMLQKSLLYLYKKRRKEYNKYINQNGFSDEEGIKMQIVKKILCLAMASVMIFGTLCGCVKDNKEKKVDFYVGHWPPESEMTPETRQDLLALKNEYEKKYPYINVLTTKNYFYDSRDFEEKMEAGEVPTFLGVFFTEVEQIKNMGYAADITNELRENGILDKISPDMLSLVTYDNGKICGIPTSIYAQGLLINKSIFKEAGLFGENGQPKIPRTYEELAETAKIIKERTGKAGFLMPTVNKQCGWIFMNIAWSYGVEFEEQQHDGTWKAVFDTKEFKDALSYVRDLKWKYDVLPDETEIDERKSYEIFSRGDVGMMIADINTVSEAVVRDGINKDDIYMAKIPEGPKGRYSQVGGGIRMMFSQNTPEQNDAAIKWLMMEGFTPEITPEIEKELREKYEKTIADGGIVLPQELLGIWRSDERDAKMKEILSDYANVDMKNFADYYDFKGVTLRPEEPISCQQLYEVLGGVIKEVTTNENADIDALAKEAVNYFQKTHLYEVN